MKGRSILGLIVSLAVLGSSTIFQNKASAEPHRMFNTLLPQLERRTRVPILLPRELPQLLLQRSNSFYLHLEKADANGYKISILTDPNCRGANVCFLGSLSAERISSTAAYASPSSVRELQSQANVSLRGGIKGFFKPLSCGGSCSPPSLQWVYQGVLYEISLRTSNENSDTQRSILVAMASSSLPETSQPTVATSPSSRQQTRAARSQVLSPQSRRTIPFTICSESQTWVRPSEREQITRINSIARLRQINVLTNPYWTDNIILLTSYGLNALTEPMFLSGLWTISDDIFKCYRAPGIIEKINAGQVAEIWLLQQRLKRIYWQNNQYVIVVDTTNKGAQFVQFSRVERLSSLSLRVETESGQELAFIQSQGGAIASGRLNLPQTTIGRSQSSGQQTAAGRSPSSGQQRGAGRSASSGEELVVENLGCTSNLRNIIGQSAPDYCRSAEADSLILFDSLKVDRQADRSIKMELRVFNRGSADGLIEVYNSKGNLVDIKILDGNIPPTGLIQSGSDMFIRGVPNMFFSRYPLGDLRRDLKEQDVSLTIPRGGYIKITKSSNFAFLYNSGLLALEIALLKSGDPDFAKSETVKKFLIGFAQEFGTKATINIFKGEPSLQAAFSLDFLDKNKLAQVLQKLVQYSATVEKDPSKNPLIGAFKDTYIDGANIGIENALDRYILPGLGTFARGVRIGGSAVNTFARAADLHNAKASGEKATITIRDASTTR